MSKETKIIEDCVQRLIDTLGTMEADKADAIVKQVATTLMNDVLHRDGYIKQGASGYLTKQSGCEYFFSYEWKSLDE